MKKIIEDIAKKYCHVDTLATRNRDCLDFYDMAIWNIKDALEAAYQAGYSKRQEEILDNESNCKDCGFRHPGGTCLDS